MPLCSLGIIMSLCFTGVTLVVIVSVCVRPSLRTLKSVTAEECTFAGGHRNSVVSLLLYLLHL